MSYFTWNNNQITTTSDQVTYGDTTILGTCNDKGQGYFLSPVYISTQLIYSFSTNSKLEVVYWDGLNRISSSVEVGAFNDPVVTTTAYSGIDTTITYASDTGTDIGSILHYSGKFRTFPPSSYGNLSDVSTISSYEITASVSSYSRYQYSGVTYITFSETDSQFGTSTFSETFPSSTTINKTEPANPLTTYPSFWGLDYVPTPALFTSSTNNKSWASNNLYYRYSNANSIPESGTISQETIITTTSETGFSQNSDGDWVTSQSWYRAEEPDIIEYFTSSSSSSDYIYSYESVTFDFTNTTSIIVGANVGFSYPEYYIDPNWGFWDRSGGLTNVHAFISPVQVSELENIENIGIANYRNAKIFFPKLNIGDVLFPRTQYGAEVLAVTDGLGIVVNGISETWNIPTFTTAQNTSTTGTTTAWGVSTSSGVFTTSYSATSTTTSMVGAGNAQIVYPQGSSGNFLITLTYNGIFGATTLDGSDSSTSVFTATTNSSISASSTTITLQSNQAFQIITDWFWMNQGSLTGIL
jgi:hypothetical protein